MTGAVSPDRRRFLTAGAAVLGAAASAQLWLPTTARAADTPLPGGVFSLGVTSGDPLPDGIVLWTRLAPDPLNGGGMPDTAVAVQWEVATDEKFAKVVRRGTAQARPEYGHSVHVDVRGLRPGRVHWYRFRAGGRISPTGRTRTAPHPSATGGTLRVALASCQNWQHGYFTPYADMLDQDPDFVLFVGDYIYESSPSTATGTPSTARTRTSPRCTRTPPGWSPSTTTRSTTTSPARSRRTRTSSPTTRSWPG